MLIRPSVRRRRLLQSSSFLQFVSQCSIPAWSSIQTPSSELWVRISCLCLVSDLEHFVSCRSVVTRAPDCVLRFLLVIARFCTSWCLLQGLASCISRLITAEPPSLALDKCSNRKEKLQIGARLFRTTRLHRSSARRIRMYTSCASIF